MKMLRRYLLTTVLAFLCLGAEAQLPSGCRPAIPSCAGARRHQCYAPRDPRFEAPLPASGGSHSRTASLSGVRTLGSSSNAFSTVRIEQNQVFVHNGLNCVGFIHRQNTSFFGGNSGNLRFDISRNGGQNWVNDAGPLNPLLTQTARFPMGTFFLPPGETSVDSLRLVWFAPAQNASQTAWEGYTAGACQPTLAPAGSENYVFQTRKGHLPGGLCEGAPGVFWAVAQSTDGAPTPLTLDSLVVYRGEWSPSLRDVVWDISAVIPMQHNRSFDGQPYLELSLIHI